MSLQFNNKLYKLKQINDHLTKQMQLFQKVCNEGNPPLISLHELNASAIVKKMGIVERNAREVWKALEEEYGVGFFRKVVEEEYGLVEELEGLKKQINKDINFDRIEQN
jgi:hypothetical protein